MKFAALDMTAWHALFFDMLSAFTLYLEMKLPLFGCSRVIELDF